ncbi:hypothetical protein GCM10025857_33260 [Alicyclobacillus contaminans]|nr:hypothetical protein GCM10025857_33260 [Alicyclobacillus contaminans]
MALDLTRWSPEQRRAIQASGHNVLVSAGAGSGKTSVLVERVVRHVMEPGGTDLLRLLVVTFTEAAAAEMRRRIEQRLRGLLEEARANADARTAARLQRLLSQVEQAQISTLHSFCMQVVRDNFAFLGLNPVFSLLSEDDGVLLRAEVLEGLLEAELAGENGAMLAQTVTHLAGGNPDTFRQLVLRLHDFAVSQPEPLAWLAAMAALYDSAGAPAAERLPWYPPFIRWAKRQLDAALRDFEQAHRVAATSEGLSSYAENLTALLNLCQSTRAALDEVSDFSAAADALLAIRGLKTPRTSAKGWDKEWVTARRNAGLARVKRVLPWFERGLDALCDDVLALRPHVHTLVAFVRAFHARYQEVKRANGQLDFYDLEHFTLAVLSNPASGEADRLREQFDELLIDEYQDTSPIQDAIVQCLTKPEGNQFVVGDVKQSIYRFRMAEPNLFLDKYQMLGRLEPGEVIDLTANYRSRPEVVHAVNFLFEQLFSPAMGGSFTMNARGCKSARAILRKLSTHWPAPWMYSCWNAARRQSRMQPARMKPRRTRMKTAMTGCLWATTCRPQRSCWPSNGRRR